MLRPPPLTVAPYYPVTSAVAVGAIVVSVMKWMGQDVSPSFMDYHVWANGEIWRALTATLPHGGPLHLLFNLYWLWTFGTLVERVYGHFKGLAIYLLLALGSMLAEFAVLNGGIGLSGIVYGLWGLLMIMERSDPRFAEAVDAQTNQTFVIWFFICIGTTITHVMPVANIAHGMGAVIGILLGFAISGDLATKWKSRVGLAGLMVLILLGATVFWPRVNLSGFAGWEIEQGALDALDRENVSRAVKWLEIATQKRNAPAHAWYNLGVAYQHAGRFEDAMTAFNHAAAMPDADEQILRAVQPLRRPSPAGTNQ